MDIVLHTIVPSENNEVSIDKINANFRILSEQGVIIGDPVVGEKGEQGNDGKGSKGDRGGLHFLYDGSDWGTWINLTKQKILDLTGDDGGLKSGDVIITSYTGVDLLTRVSVATGGSVVQPNPADPSTYEIDFNAIINKGLAESESQSFRRVYEGDDIGKNLVAYDRIVGNNANISDFRLILANNGNNNDLKSFTESDGILTISSDYVPVGILNNVSPYQIRLTGSIGGLANNLGVPSRDLYIGRSGSSDSVPWTISAGRPDTINQSGSENKNLGLLIKAQSRYSNTNYAHNVYVGGNSLERAVGSAEDTSIGVDGIAYCKKNDSITASNLALGHDGRGSGVASSGYSGIFGKSSDGNSSCIGFRDRSILFQAKDDYIKFEFDDLIDFDIINGLTTGPYNKILKTTYSTTSYTQVGFDKLSILRSVSANGGKLSLKIYAKDIFSAINNRVTLEMPSYSSVISNLREYPELATNARWVFQRDVAFDNNSKFLNGNPKGEFNIKKEKYNNFSVGLATTSLLEGLLSTSDVDNISVTSGGTSVDVTVELDMKSIPISITTGKLNIAPSDPCYINVSHATGAISLSSGLLSDYVWPDIYGGSNNLPPSPTNIYSSVADYLGTTGNIYIKSGQLRSVSGGLTIDDLTETTIMPKKLSESGGFTIETGGLATDSILINGDSKYSALQKSGDVFLSTGSSNYVGGITIETGLLKKSSQYVTWSETNVSYYDYGFYNNTTQALSASLVLNGYSYDNKDNWYLSNCNHRIATGNSHSVTVIKSDSPYYFYNENHLAGSNNKIKARFASPIEYSKDLLEDCSFDAIVAPDNLANKMLSWNRDVTKMGILRLSAGLDIDPYLNSDNASVKRGLDAHNKYYITKNTLEDVLVKNGSFYGLYQSSEIQVRTINESCLNKLGAQSLSLFSANTMLQQSFSDIVIHAGGHYGSSVHMPAYNGTVVDSTTVNNGLGQSLDGTNYRTIYLHKNFTYPNDFVLGTRTVVESEDFIIRSNGFNFSASSSVGTRSGKLCYVYVDEIDGSLHYIVDVGSEKRNYTIQTTYVVVP